MLVKHKSEYKGISFDSRDEMRRFIELESMEESGRISCLNRQVSFLLLPSVYRDEVVHLKTKDKVVRRCVEHEVRYTCDFLYIEDGTVVCEDCKSWFTRSHCADYPLRRKLMVRKIYDHNSSGGMRWIFREYIVGTKKRPGKIIDR